MLIAELESQDEDLLPHVRVLVVMVPSLTPFSDTGTLTVVPPPVDTTLAPYTIAVTFVTARWAGMTESEMLVVHLLEFLSPGHRYVLDAGPPQEVESASKQLFAPTGLRHSTQGRGDGIKCKGGGHHGGLLLECGRRSRSLSRLLCRRTADQYSQREQNQNLESEHLSALAHLAFVRVSDGVRPIASARS